ncbi:hypothetical protein K501DRAFT_254329 [Backusella circina FSU 941]|nr:hypothetical protein K501DRAFT_254329 [Backusella circina FSU 941]
MSDILHQTRNMVSEYMSGFDPSHDMYHVDRVTRLALTIAKDGINQGQDIDLEMVELAALCHDVGDRKYYNGKETGGQLIQIFLNQHNYAKADLVAKIVDHIGFSKELGWDDKMDPAEQVQWRNTCLELHAVQDADKLDAIGAFGILRCAAYSGAKNRTLYVPNDKPIENLTQEVYQNQTESSAINHFHEKLFKLKDMMRTPKGKSLALERHQFMELFVSKVNDEYNMIG